MKVESEHINTDVYPVSWPFLLCPPRELLQRHFTIGLFFVVVDSTAAKSLWYFHSMGFLRFCAVFAHLRCLCWGWKGKIAPRPMRHRERAPTTTIGAAARAPKGPTAAAGGPRTGKTRRWRCRRAKVCFSSSPGASDGVMYLLLLTRCIYNIHAWKIAVAPHCRRIGCMASCSPFFSPFL